MGLSSSKLHTPIYHQRLFDLLIEHGSWKKPKIYPSASHIYPILHQISPHSYLLLHSSVVIKLRISECLVSLAQTSPHYLSRDSHYSNLLYEMVHPACPYTLLHLGLLGSQPMNIDPLPHCPPIQGLSFGSYLNCTVSSPCTSCPLPSYICLPVFLHSPDTRVSSPHTTHRTARHSLHHIYTQTHLHSHSKVVLNSLHGHYTRPQNTQSSPKNTHCAHHPSGPQS